MDQDQLVTIRRDLHKIPEIGFKETKTQAYLLSKIAEMDQTHLTVYKWETGLLVKVNGKEPKGTIGYRADIDGLPITEDTDFPFQSEHEGYMHACGHDFHMTIALGALNRLSKEPVNDHVLFIFQPAEEGPGGAQPLLESTIFKELKPDCIFALHVAPEMPVGHVSSKPGMLFANTSELFIDFKGKGGHAAYPHLTHDMVLAASGFVTQLQHIVSRQLDPIEQAVVTIGKINGGTVQNIISETARIEGTIRTGDANSIATIKQAIERFAKGFEQSHHCKIDIDYGSNYYQVFNDASFIEQFKSIVDQSTLNWHDASEAMTGEDFGYFLKEIPGFMFWLGVDSEYGLHQSRLNPDEEALSVGVDIVERTIRHIEIN
ncbi:N-acetyldiaminopimelate deacetylase [Pelagirhabdus alkalitolerans]|uniref:N-acetyldiaminopimelate deacetylase n=1 Tax=Pelagirhabdus alkalitolerans TaxID=1612202 RepID=A0A1G6GYQ3_9BACI|nr:N-acetyldiaminopimelate deacetylase [Pelagirhabdus alkalitolerans]SDB87091.1 N-acetyldiaminopimelate deacetylase [Pelagirhabdus alkalitolerans]